MSASGAGRSTMRSIAAVIAGILFTVVLSTAADAAMHATGAFPPWGEPMADGLFGLALAYRLVLGLLGAMLTARLAPRNPLTHVLVLGALGTVASAAGAAATWNQGPAYGPKWYALALVVTALPLAWLGGVLAGAGRHRHAAVARN